MELVTDNARGTWIVERAGDWATVGGVAGVGFEAYARVLHPIVARRDDLTRTDEWGQHPTIEEALWPWATVAEHTGRLMHPLVQWLRLTADESLVHFADGWSIEQCPQGWFDPRLFASLSIHLTDATTTPDEIVIAIWDGWGFDSDFSFYMTIADDSDDEESERNRVWAEQTRKDASESVSADVLEAVNSRRLLEYPGRDFVLMQGSLAELADPAWGYRAGIGWTRDRPEPTPQMVWPSDRAWVVASEIDWDSTIVAGPRALIDGILADTTFETFEVQENDMLTHDSDLLNQMTP